MNIRILLVIGALLTQGVQPLTSIVNAQDLPVKHEAPVGVIKPAFFLLLETSNQIGKGNVTLALGDTSVSMEFQYTPGAPTYITLETNRSTTGGDFIVGLYGLQSQLSLSSRREFYFDAIQTTTTNSSLDGTIDQYIGDFLFSSKHSSGLVTTRSDNTDSFQVYLLPEEENFINLRTIDQFRFFFPAHTQGSSVYIEAIPEPSTIALLGLTLIILGFSLFKNRKSNTVHFN